MQNNNIDLNFNGKLYKTEAALKRAKTILNKSQLKQTKSENYKTKIGAEKLQSIITQRATTKELNKNFGLPVYTPDYQPTKPQTIRKDRLKKFNEEVYTNKGTKNKLKLKPEDVDLKLFPFINRTILNGAFTELTIRNEPFNEDLSKQQLYNIYIHNEKEILRNIIFLNNITNIIYKELVRRFTKENTSTKKTKILSVVTIKYIFFEKEGNEYSENERYYNSRFSDILKSPTQIKEYVENIVEEFYQHIEACQGGSEGYFYKIDNIKILLARRKVTKAGKFIELPDIIKNKQACLNVKNKDDNFCLIWCLLAQKYNKSIKSKDKNELYHYKKHFNEIIQPKDIIYPIDIQHDIPKFEKLNNIKINVFQYDKNFIKLQTLYNTNERNENVINLLLIDEPNEDGTKNEHLIWIKSINKLLRFDDKHEKRYWCTQCLNSSYKTQELLNKHQLLCYNHESVATKLPTKTIKDKKTGEMVENPNYKIKFKNEQNKFMHPVNCFLDFESTLTNIDNKIGDGSLQYQHHQVNSCGIKFNCIHNEFSKPIKIINNRDTEKVLKQTIETLEEYAKYSYEIIEKNKMNNNLTLEQKRIHWSKTQCDECKETFTKTNKCRHHDHITGKYISTICGKCNLKFQYKKFLPVYVHNLKNYDGHFIVNAMAKYGYQNNENNIISAIPNNEERYISFSKKIKVGEYKKDDEIKPILFEIRFLDTFAFMGTSLCNLVENLKKNVDDITELRNIYKNTSDYFKDDEQFKLMIKKGIYPYDFIDNYNKMYTTILPTQDKFYSKLNESECDDKDYLTAQIVWDKFKCEKFLDYHNIYLISDVLLLNDVWENFRKTCFKIYGLDTSYYYTSPGLSWDAFLKHKHDETKGNFYIELLTNQDMYLFYESGIRGGLSQITKRYAKANNKYMSNYNNEKMDEYILYLDANNLYGYAMSQHLPQKDFKWNNQSWNDEKILNISDDNKIGYTFDVDLHYPKELHDKHNNYPLAPENLTIKKEWLNEWQQEDYNETKIKKLITNFNDKSNYVINYRILKLYLKLGLKITKINRVLQYEQDNYMKSYIMKNTNERKTAKNDFEKDFYKLMNNSVYGKTMENVRNRITFILVSSEKKALNMKNNYKKFTIFNDNLVGVHLCKQEVILNKPIFIGQTVLDQSKYLMYDFHYNFILEKFKRQNVDLLFTDTDSLCYHFKNEDPFKIINENKNLFDLSEYPENNKLFDSTNKKVIGKFKNESIEQITEYVGLRSKLYAYTVDKEEYDHKRCKGVKKYVVDKKLTLELYKEILHNRKTHSVMQNGFISDLHEIYTQSQKKISLSATDDKVFICNNNINTYNHGHYKTLKK